MPALNVGATADPKPAAAAIACANRMTGLLPYLFARGAQIKAPTPAVAMPDVPMYDPLAIGTPKESAICAKAGFAVAKLNDPKKASIETWMAMKILHFRDQFNGCEAYQ